MRINFLSLGCLIILGLTVRSELQAGKGSEGLESQNDQINACINFAKNPLAEREMLQKISEGNFQKIQKTVEERFGANSANASFAKDILTKAMSTFDKGNMDLKALAKYYVKVTWCLSNVIQPERREIFDSPSQHEVWIDESPLLPIPVISQKGEASLGKLSDLISSGCYYLAIPLAQEVEFDGSQSDPFGMAHHDVTHAVQHLRSDYAELKDEGVSFAQMLNQKLLNTAKTPEEKKINNIIRFLAFHEARHSLNPMRHECSTVGLARYKARREDAKLGLAVKFDEWAQDLLEDASKQTEVFSKLFIDYTEKKHLISFPENATVDEKAAKFTSVIQEKIKELQRDIKPN